MATILATGQQMLRGEQEPFPVARLLGLVLKALARVAANDRLAKGLGMTKSDVRPVAAEPPVTVYLKGGEKVEGRLVRDDADWIAVETDKATVNVRRSEVMRVDQHKK